MITDEMRTAMPEIDEKAAANEMRHYMESAEEGLARVPRAVIANWRALLNKLHLATRPRSEPSAEMVEAARDAIERLANVQMNISLADWCEISSTILAALANNAKGDRDRG